MLALHDINQKHRAQIQRRENQGERFLRGLTTTSIEGVIAGHLIFAQRDAQFPRGFNSNLLPVDVRLCVNYYFDMTRKQKTIEPGVPPQP